MLSRIFCFLCVASVVLRESEGSWWSSDETTPSTTEDAECDWSLDGEMGIDTGTSGVTNGGVTGYVPNTSSNGYGVNSAGTGHVQGVGNGYTQGTGTGYPQGTGTVYPQGTGNGYTQGAGTVYPQGTGTGYTQGAGTVYPQGTGTVYPQGTGTGYTQGTGTGHTQGAGNGYVLNSAGTAYIPQSSVQTGYPQTTYNNQRSSFASGSGSFITPQSQQRFFPRQIYYLNQNEFVGLHPRLPIGSYVTVTNPDSPVKKSVVVQIVGRPKDLAFGRCLTLSKVAFAQLADLEDGVTHCTVVPSSSTPTY